MLIASFLTMSSIHSMIVMKYVSGCWQVKIYLIEEVEVEMGRATQIVTYLLRTACILPILRTLLSSRTTFLWFAKQRDGNATCVDDSDGISTRAGQTCSINDWGFREDGHCHFQNDIAYWILDSACIFHAAGVSLKMEAAFTPARRRNRIPKKDWVEIFSPFIDMLAPGPCIRKICKPLAYFNNSQLSI